MFSITRKVGFVGWDVTVARSAGEICDRVVLSSRRGPEESNRRPSPDSALVKKGVTDFMCDV